MIDAISLYERASLHYTPVELPVATLLSQNLSEYSENMYTLLQLFSLDLGPKTEWRKSIVRKVWWDCNMSGFPVVCKNSPGTQ